ncbi:MAG: hypothetical protein EOP61_00545 [Sphingomonadales bacterium]|nr:MAG: hypothetical protein EOP61_00545 [Sphingomonadales bacterium]
MTRYYFHLYNDEITHDEEGMELADLDAAREWGRREVQYQAAESVKAHGHLILSHRLVICDAGGEVATITFGDVVRVG